MSAKYHIFIKNLLIISILKIWRSDNCKSVMDYPLHIDDHELNFLTLTEVSDLTSCQPFWTRPSEQIWHRLWSNYDGYVCTVNRVPVDGLALLSTWQKCNHNYHCVWVIDSEKNYYWNFTIWTSKICLKIIHFQLPFHVHLHIYGIRDLLPGHKINDQISCSISTKKYWIVVKLPKIVKYNIHQNI